METIKWDSKEYKMPFKADYFKQKADKFKELIIVRNRFNNEPALLPWFAVAVYDTIIGAEQAEDYDTMRKGCLLYTSPSPRDGLLSRMPSSA